MAKEGKADQLEIKQTKPRRKPSTGSRWAAGILLLVTLGLGAFFYLLGIIKTKDLGFEIPRINLKNLFRPKVYHSD